MGSYANIKIWVKKFLNSLPSDRPTVFYVMPYTNVLLARFDREYYYIYFHVCFSHYSSLLSQEIFFKKEMTCYYFVI